MTAELHQFPAAPEIPRAMPDAAGGPADEGEKQSSGWLDIYRDVRWCPNCGGPQTFVPVDRFVGGWRGYCLGCDEEKFVMVSRAESEAA